MNRYRVPRLPTTTYTYDSLGRLVQTAAPLGRTTSSTFDANGNKLSDTDARGNVTSYQYDSLNRLTTTTYPTSPVTSSTKTYDFRNNVIDETDQAGHVTHHVYDLSGRQISVTHGYGSSTPSTTTDSYYADGRKQTETDALGHVTNYTYDAAGRMIATAGVQGNFTYAYDDAGNRVSSTDANGNTTQFRYDARKRLVITIYPDGTSSTNGYDGPGNLTLAVDQAGASIQYNYDDANQLSSVVQLNHPIPAHNTNNYQYDNDGNLTTLTDENGHSTVNAFDVLADPVSKTLPDGSLTEQRTYDAAGNLTTLRHFNGKTTTYTYDALNRLITRTPDPTLNEPTVSFTYTATGKYASSTDASGTTTYAYDALDRLTAKATPEGTLNYTYDAAGHVASIVSSNANGASMAYTYDALNRLSTVLDNRLPAGQNTTTYAYDPASNIATATYPNGLTSTYKYDQLNRITALTTPTSGYAYQLGPTGNRTSATELTGRTLNWSYNGVYQLTQESIAADPAGVNGVVGYSLDPVGNRLQTTSSLAGIAPGIATYNPDDELAAETYDANGNAIRIGSNTFAYDSENHLVSMNGGQVTIVYDAFGNRVAETAAGVTTGYLVDDLNPTGYAQVVDELTNGTVAHEYTLGLQRISERQLVDKFWASSFYSYDGGGSVAQLTTLSASVTDTYEYDAFGNLTKSSGNTPNIYLYRGEQYDHHLDLYYLRARYYTPAAGIFTSRDPEDGDITEPRTLRKYIYAADDPINRVDPSGRATLLEGLDVEDDIDTKAPTDLEPVRQGVICKLTLATSTLAAIAASIYSHTVYLPIVYPDACIAIGLRLGHIEDHGEKGDDTPEPEPQPTPEPGPRTIPPPPPPRKGCTCTCRADADDSMPGNIKPGLPLFAFGTATENSCSAAAKEAKRIATHSLRMKPKHVGCKCAEK